VSFSGVTSLKKIYCSYDLKGSDTTWFGRKYQFTRRHIPEDFHFHIYSSESFKSHVFHLGYQDNRELQSTGVTQINTSAVLINFTDPKLSIRYTRTCKHFLRQKTGNLGSVVVQFCVYTTLTKSATFHVWFTKLSSEPACLLMKVWKKAFLSSAEV
jgi:hypothetical protein